MKKIGGEESKKRPFVLCCCCCWALETAINPSEKCLAPFLLVLRVIFAIVPHSLYFFPTLSFFREPLFSVAISLRYRDSQLPCFIAATPLVIKNEGIATSPMDSSFDIQPICKAFSAHNISVLSINRMKCVSMKIHFQNCIPAMAENENKSFENPICCESAISAMNKEGILRGEHDI